MNKTEYQATIAVLIGQRIADLKLCNMSVQEATAQAREEVLDVFLRLWQEQP